MRPVSKAGLFVLSIGIAAISFGCSLRSVATSTPSRIFREVHGLRVRSYELTPVSDDRRHYRRIEIHPLENLMLAEIPEPTVKQLNDEIITRTQSLKRFEQVTQVDEKGTPAANTPDQQNPETQIGESPLVVEG